MANPDKKKTFGAGALGNVPELLVACSKGDLKRVELLVLGGADVNQQHDMLNQVGQRLSGVTPMYMAAQGGHVEVCKFLFQKGADPCKAVVVMPQGVAYTPSEVAMLFGSWRTWWFLSRKNFVRTYRGSAIKCATARSQYRDLDADIAHQPDQAGRSPLI